MISFIFMCLLAVIFIRLALFAFKAAWKIGKVVLFLVFLPLTIIFTFLKGLMAIAWPLLALYGLYCLIKAK